MPKIAVNEYGYASVSQHKVGRFRSIMSYGSQPGEALVFHRFIAGDAQQIIIKINGRHVEAWDPFLENNEATIPSPEQQVSAPGGKVRVRGFVLPHRDRFQSKEASSVVPVAAVGVHALRHST